MPCASFGFQGVSADELINLLLYFLKRFFLYKLHELVGENLPGLRALDLPAAGSPRRWVTRLLRVRPFLQLGSSRVRKLVR